MLVHAHREELPRHERARAWLERLAAGPEPFAIPIFCVNEFLRVVTHPHLFDPPSTIEQATAAIDGLLRCPNLRLLHPEERYPELLLQAIRSAGARGNLVFDAAIAACLREHGVRRLLTEDRDFARFDQLQPTPPAAELY